MRRNCSSFSLSPIYLRSVPAPPVFLSCSKDSRNISSKLPLLPFSLIQTLQYLAEYDGASRKERHCHGCFQRNRCPDCGGVREERYKCEHISRSHGLKVLPIGHLSLQTLPAKMLASFVELLNASFYGQEGDCVPTVDNEDGIVQHKDIRDSSSISTIKLL